MNSKPANPPLSEEERLDWLQLARCENVGPATFRDLIDHFGSADAAIDALPALAHRGGRRAIKICDRGDAASELERTNRLNARIVAQPDGEYPNALRHIDAPPPILTVAGDRNILARPMVAIVGSRNCSIAGRKLASRFAGDLGQAGLVIASGLARGIDGVAHEAAISTGTVAVMAGGINHIYPPEHREMVSRIIEAGGALMTEMPLGWEPRARDFPRRNRLISGLSLGVIVVEAARRSGSLHTARFAAEQGRIVFAIPGSPLDPRSDGCNQLIRQGATLVAEPAHVLDAVSPLLENPPLPPLQIREDEAAAGAPPTDIASGQRHSVVDALGPSPVTVDDIIRHTGLPAREILLVLLELDLAGRLERHGQQMVSLLPESP